MATFLLAEIGINHNGDMALAKQLIDAAADAGFDAVKFQKRTIDAVYLPEFLASPRQSPWGDTQRAQKEGLEFDQAGYIAIDAHCRARGVQWSASAWDVEAQLFLHGFDLPFNKVASPMLGNGPLLRKIVAERKPTYISTGMATLAELDAIVALFRAGNCPFELMHCVSVYPLPPQDANLLLIPMLRERYGCPVGYSGHEAELVEVSQMAATLGATSIERHITLDRTMYGSDQSASIEAAELGTFVQAIRRVPAILGTGTKTLTAGETMVRTKLRVDVGAVPTTSDT